MADSLRFKGAKDITKRIGSGMRLVRPKRGGDTHQVKQWWGLKQTCLYTNAAIFNVTTDFGSVQLIIPVDTETTELQIRHDGSGNFTFPYNRACDRVAVYSADRSVFYKEYQFSKISGGAMVTRTVTAYPAVETVVAFGTGTSLSGTAVVGETLTATAASTSGGKGTVSTNLIFQVSDTGSGGWSFLAGNPGTASGGTATYTIQSGDSGKYIRASYQVTDDDGTVSNNSSATNVIADTLATRISNATYTYTVTVVNTAAEGDPAVNVYALNGTNQQAVAASVGESIAFDFSAVASAHPLGIFTDSTKTTPVTVGVETGGAGNATLLFTPPITGSFSYQCINHANMGGDITVS